MLKIISLRWYRRLIKGKMCIVDCTAQINVDVIQHRPRRTLLMLPHDGHADTDPLSLLTAFISLIPSSCFPPFACSPLYICTKPILHSAFSFSAFGHCMPSFCLLSPARTQSYTVDLCAVVISTHQWN